MHSTVAWLLALLCGRRSLALAQFQPGPDIWLLRVVLGDFCGHQEPSRIAETTGDKAASTENKQSKSQQLKRVFHEHGAVGVSLHVGISLISLDRFMVVSSGVDMSAILHKRSCRCSRKWHQAG